MSSNKWPKIPAYSMRYATVGIEFIGIFLIFLGLGIWLDGRWGTSPWLTLSGMVAGFAGSLCRMSQIIREYRREQESSSHEK